MLESVPFLVCLGAGTIAGVFFAFSAFVMKALVQLPAGQGVAAMQRINALVLNPWFLAVFIGTAAFAALCVVAGFFPWGSVRSLLLLAAGLSYMLGSFGVTAVFNVPRNNKLALLEAESEAAAAYWPAYVRGWLLWNHVRMAASLLAAACAAGALAS